MDLKLFLLKEVKELTVRKKLFSAEYETKDINISINLTQSDLEKIDSLIGEHGITDIKIEQIETTTYLIIQLDSLSYVLDIPVRVNKKHYVVKAKFTHKQDRL